MNLKAEGKIERRRDIGSSSTFGALALHEPSLVAKPLFTCLIEGSSNNYCIQNFLIAANILQVGFGRFIVMIAELFLPFVQTAKLLKVETRYSKDGQLKPGTPWRYGRGWISFGP